MKTIIICVAICFAKTLEIVLQSLNASFSARGERKMAIPFVLAECTLWGLVIYSLWNVIGENPVLMLAYCGGYGLGMLLGPAIESQIAVGTSSVQMIITKEHVETVKNFMRQKQLGITILPGYGLYDASYVAIVIMPRKIVKSTIKEIAKLCNNKVFVVASEVSQFSGGFGVKNK